jgi:hypothetical protein
VHYNLRPAQARRKPARLRHLQARDFETTTFIGSSNVGNFGRMDSKKDRVVKRKLRTIDQKRKRRERERGPWKCSLCGVFDFSSINGLRGHVATTHRQYCSWTGKIRPFQTLEEEQKFVDGVRRGRQHRRGTSSAIATAATAAVTSQSNGPQPTPSDPVTPAVVDVMEMGDVTPSTSSGRVMRVDWEQPLPMNGDDFTEWLAAFQEVVDGAVAEKGAFVSSRSPISTSVQQLTESTPMTATSDNGCQATTVTTSVDTMTEQSWLQRHTVGVQTPSGPPLDLPVGWSVPRLVRMALAEPTRTPRALALTVSREFDEPLPGCQFPNTELVLQACCETVRQVLDETVRFQLRYQQGDSARYDEHRHQFEIWINNMRNRAYGFYGPHFEHARASLPLTFPRQPTARRGRHATRGEARPAAPGRSARRRNASPSRRATKTRSVAH